MPSKAWVQARDERARKSKTPEARVESRGPEHQGAQPGIVAQRARHAPEALNAPDILRLQAMIGNRALGQILTSATQAKPPRRLASPSESRLPGRQSVQRSQDVLSPETEMLATPVQREIEFARFKQYGKLSNWGWYNDAEKKIVDLLKRARELLTGLAAHQQDSRFGRQVIKLTAQLDDLDGKTYETKDYPGVADRLKGVFDNADDLSAKIAARDFRQDKELDKLLTGAFEVVDDKAEKKKPNQLTAKELADVRGILNDVFRGERSNLNIDVQMPFANLDLAQRAGSLGLDAPPELLPLELQIHTLENRAQDIGIKELDPLIEEKMKIQLSKAADRDAQLKDVQDRINVVKEKQAVLQEKADELKLDYKAVVEEMVKHEVLKDLVKIAQTGVGRDLLQTIAKTSLEANAKKVTIRAYDQYIAPDAGQDKVKQNPYVNYTPQYFRDRDTKQREPGGAIRKAEELAKNNPWQENARTDITLFHELVHTHHHQSGTAKTDNQLVGAEEAVDKIDRPYEKEKETRGVREEEYYTVGLGKYAKDKFTENAYRAERRQLGEEVAPREYYTHKDERGDPIAL